MTDTVYTVIYDQLMRDEVDSVHRCTLPISEEFFRFTP